ncbi:GIY-YIG nuclease family protein [Elizabethkingia anophelis]|uniref:GIY-YIG nuclease family protein n=1 Tax=Elizabethkingia anophelis TaxID=1117645 RepID=UPI001C877B0B|nr:GIY-YIG nuclease family protein [Elizabethkingia anophelis]
MKHSDFNRNGHRFESCRAHFKKPLQKCKGFTSRAKDWMIIYSEAFNDKSSAYKREREIKAWKSKKKIEQLIKSSTG